MSITFLFIVRFALNFHHLHSFWLWFTVSDPFPLSFDDGAFFALMMSDVHFIAKGIDGKDI